MGIETRILFLKNLEDKLKTEIVASDMDKVLSAVMSTLDNYEIVSIKTEEDHEDYLLNSYISALRIQGRSEKTIAGYKRLIEHMLNTLCISTKNVNIYHLRNYLSKEKERGLSDATLEHYRQIISTYFGWLLREGLISSNPAANLGTIKCPKKIKEIFSDIEIEKIKMACGKNIRNRAIISFLYSTGCRVGEVIGLNINDVNLDTLECTVLGKGNKERTVFIDSVTGMLLRRYYETRTDDCEALFVNKYGKRFESNGIRDLLNRLSKASGVKHVHPHKFRRTLATNLIKHGMPIQEVAAILGHDKLDTTMEYVVLDRSDVKYSYLKHA